MDQQARPSKNKETAQKQVAGPIPVFTSVIECLFTAKVQEG